MEKKIEEIAANQATHDKQKQAWFASGMRYVISNPSVFGIPVKQEEIQLPCNNCQGGGCPVCYGYGVLSQSQFNFVSQEDYNTLKEVSIGYLKSIRELKQQADEMREALEQIDNSPHPCNESEMHSWIQSARNIVFRTLTNYENQVR